jgi:fluoride exporter
MAMIWYIALGSALGGVSRYLVGALVQRLATTTFPTGTLVVNVTACFVLGIVIRYATETPSVSPDMRAFLTVGFCGGYSTFSTFTFETVRLLEDGEWTRAAAYIALSLLVSIGAMFLGFAAARQLLVWRLR